MAEAEHHISRLDDQALGEALGTRSATVHDVAYGEGQLFSAGHGAARLEIYPQTGVTRLTAADMRVELFRTAAASVAETGVEFHRSQPDQEASLTVLPGGGVVFTFVAGSERKPASPQLERYPPDPGRPTGTLPLLRSQLPNPHPSPPTLLCRHPPWRHQPLHRRSGQSPPRPHHGPPNQPQATLRKNPAKQGQSKLPECS